MKPSPSPSKSLQSFAEIALVFAVFALFGGWPIPDSNEPHYIGKAIHFWNPDWIPNDDFLQSKDAHWTFYATFGWLSFVCSPYGMAWVGRTVTWGLLAWSWRRLSRAVIPIRWMAVPTALVLASYVQNFHMAGEWLLGGVEGKSFAFPFVFFGLEAMIRGRWHRTWIFLGIASAFHVLLGGWSVLVAGMVWVTTGGWQQLLFPSPTCGGGLGSGHHTLWGRYHPPYPSPPLPMGGEGKAKLLFSKNTFSCLPWGLFVGGMISLLGLVPALLLDHGTPPEIVREAHQVYVFERVSHHLIPYLFPWTFVARFLALTGIWVFMCRFSAKNSRQKRFDAFVWGSLLLAALGFALAFMLRDNRTLAAELLRFYWFRLSDIAVPMGVAVGGSWRFLHALREVRKNVTPLEWPQLSAWLVLLGLPFCLFLLLDRLLFFNRLYVTDVQAEPALPWALTILICRGVCNRRLQLVGRRTIMVLLLYGLLLVYAPILALSEVGDARTYRAFSRVEPGNPFTAHYWIDACHWIAQNTPKNAKFWVPKEGTTFKWHSGRSDVGTWKDVPQDAVGLLQWRDMMRDLHYYRDENGEFKEDRSLTILLWWKTPEEVEMLRQKYAFDYILCTKYPELPRLTNFSVVYENEVYRIYVAK